MGNTNGRVREIPTEFYYQIAFKKEVMQAKKKKKLAFVLQIFFSKDLFRTVDNKFLTLQSQ